MSKPNPLKTAALWVGAVVIVVALGAVLIFGTGLFKKATANFRGDVAATEKIVANGSYRIAAYDQFFDLCASIQGKEATLAALKAEQAAGLTGERAYTVPSNIVALTGSRIADIAQYNADAAKTATAGQFQSSALPYRLDPTQENTTCAS
ncbi:hypothetical protein [Rhodococcoides fascians]|uniref:hypothetical protein n=1 Tax=Rhodococcoides fascians TaxID=1828 RepID=UPI00068C670B|nr:hypothetical protein [Rhodococcus fascians]